MLPSSSQDASLATVGTCTSKPPCIITQQWSGSPKGVAFIWNWKCPVVSFSLAAHFEYFTVLYPQTWCHGLHTLNASLHYTHKPNAMDHHKGYPSRVLVDLNQDWVILSHCCTDLAKWTSTRHAIVHACLSFAFDLEYHKNIILNFV